MPPAGGTDAEFTRRNTVRNLSARLHYPGVDAGLLFTGTRPVGEDNRMASRSASRRAGFCGLLRTPWHDWTLPSKRQWWVLSGSNHSPAYQPSAFERLASRNQASLTPG